MYRPRCFSTWPVLTLLCACTASSGEPTAPRDAAAVQRDAAGPSAIDEDSGARSVPEGHSRGLGGDDATPSIPDVPLSATGDSDQPMSETVGGASGDVDVASDLADEALDAETSSIPCEHTTDCSPELMCEDSSCVLLPGTSLPCFSSDDCPSDLLCVAGACGGYPGFSCSEATECLKPLKCGGGTCVYLSGVGGACADSTDCSAGLVCTVDGSAKCKVPAKVGTPCADDSACGKNVCGPVVGGGTAPFCAATVLACLNPGTSGDPCSVSGECAYKHSCDQRTPGCFGVCRAGGEEGGPCLTQYGQSPCTSKGLVCNKALASGGVCAAPGKAGTPCLYDDECASDLVCAGLSATSTCQIPSEAGGPCAVTTDCLAGLQCDRNPFQALGVCRLPAPAGTPCASAYACADGLTCLPGPGGATCSVGDKPCEDGDWCPDGYSCAPWWGATKWCTALYEPCYSSSQCPVGYACKTAPGGLDKSCMAGTYDCTTYEWDQWMCDNACGTYCYSVIGCSDGYEFYGFAITVCGQCAPEPATRLPGAPCYESVDCAAELGCVDGICADVPLGASCSSNSWYDPCSQDQWCSIGVCAAALALGQPCTVDEECGTAICDGTCTPPRAEGEACEPGECGEGLLCGSAATCVPPAGYLEPCESSADCAYAMQCEFSLCTYYGGSYGPCHDDSECLSGRCDELDFCSPQCKEDGDCLPPTRCFDYDTPLSEGSYCQIPWGPGDWCKTGEQCASLECSSPGPCKPSICL